MDIALVLTLLLFWVAIMGLIAGLDRLAKNVSSSRSDS